jgi:hypothetical protein
MRLLLVFLLVVAASCKRREPEHEVLAEAKTPPDTILFKAFDYDPRKYYLDSLAYGIVPGKRYQYWAYLTGYRFNRKFRDSLPILNEGGDTLMRAKIKSCTYDPMAKKMQSMPRTYVAIVENDSLKFVTTNAAFRDFLGTVDNVSEALFLAATYNYCPGEGGGYRIVNGNYEMHLNLADPYPSCIPTITPDEYKTVTITKDGFIKAVSRQKNNEATIQP